LKGDFGQGVNASSLEKDDAARHVHFGSESGLAGIESGALKRKPPRGTLSCAATSNNNIAALGKMRLPVAVHRL
jgi:hypothetical protein